MAMSWACGLGAESHTSSNWVFAGLSLQVLLTFEDFLCAFLPPE